MRRETDRIQAELAERELEEARQMLEAAKKKGGAKGLKIKEGAPLNKQARYAAPPGRRFRSKLLGVCVWLHAGC